MENNISKHEVLCNMFFQELFFHSKKWKRYDKHNVVIIIILDDTMDGVGNNMERAVQNGDKVRERNDAGKTWKGLGGSKITAI